MLFINAVCDVDGCETLQAFDFEDGQETFGELIGAMESLGWGVQRDGWKVTALVCPQHENQDPDQEGASVPSGAPSMRCARGDG